MALLVNSIGAFNFIALSGEVIPPQQQVILNDRPGVDGTEKVLAGLKGVPFSLVSQVDTAAYADCFTLLANYQTLIQADVQTLVHGGFQYSAYTPKFGVQVLRVVAARPPMSIVGVRGGLNPPSFGFLIARWDLIAVPT